MQNSLTCKFIELCQKGYLNEAINLWKISNESIDIHAGNEYVFRSSCINGQSSKMVMGNFKSVD
jgi:hypothetical protein